MDRRDYHIGPGAVSLLLVIVVVGMSVLGLLAMISARGDYKLTERSINFAVSEYTASAKAEEKLAELDAVLKEAADSAQDDGEYIEAIAAMLPEEMELDDRTVCWSEGSCEGRALICEVEILPLGSEARFKWTTHMFEAQMNDAF